MIEYIGGRLKKRRLPNISFVIFAICVVVGYLLIINRIQNNSIISPLPDSPQPENPIVRLFKRRKNPDELRTRIKELATGEWNNYSVFVKDLNSDFEMGLGEKVIFTAASVNKVPILASLYYAFQKGDVDMDRVITLQESDVQDYGTGSIRYDPVGSTYSVKTLARLMIEQSDNTAAYILANYVVGIDTIQQNVQAWNMAQTDITNNKTSNYDMSILFEKMFHEEITNRANTLEMLAIMTDTDFEDRLPALLPKEATVYHKIGNEVGVFHDVGIVTIDKTAYYIGIMTSDATDEKKTASLMAKISNVIFDYMKK